MRNGSGEGCKRSGRISARYTENFEDSTAYGAKKICKEIHSSTQKLQFGSFTTVFHMPFVLTDN